MHLDPDRQVLTWQGNTNQAFDIWASSSLDSQHPFVRIGAVPASGGIRQFTNVSSGRSLFYRVSRPAGVGKPQ